MKQTCCHSCKHEFCWGCLVATWRSCIPAAGPNLVCCHCNKSHAKKIRKASEKIFRAQPMDPEKYWYKDQQTLKF